MPYYVHDRNIKSEPQEHARIAVFAKSDAVAVMLDGESITFDPSPTERQAWRDREYRRLHSPSGKAYTPLPFSTPWDHYAHRAASDPTKISYTPDDTYGHEDRRLVTTPVRYLEKYAELINYSRSEFAMLAGKMRAAALELRIATTADDIGRVYCCPDPGYTSCMDAAHGFHWETAPVRTYAGGDLALAYIGQLGATPSADRIYARAVIWPTRKTYTRAYGDIDRMVELLRIEGYTRVSGWDGARIMATTKGNFWQVPYIDGASQRLRHVGDHLVIGRGEICGSNTDGLAPISGHKCEHCGDLLSNSDDSERLCSGCADDRYDCANCQDEGFGDYRMLNEDCWCPSCYRDQRRNCAHCADRYDSAESSDSDSEYCDDCRDEIVTCESCCAEGHSDDFVLIDIADLLCCKDCRIKLSTPRRRRKPMLIVRNGATAPLPHSSQMSFDTLQQWIERAR